MAYSKEIGNHLAHLVAEMVMLHEEGITGFALDHLKNSDEFKKAAPLYQKKALKAYEDSFDKHEHEGQSSAHEHGMSAARGVFERAKKNAKASANRRFRDDAMRSMGMNKVRGSVSGKTYWESAELSDEDLEMLNEDARRLDRKVAKSHWNSEGLKKKSGMKKANKTQTKNRMKKFEVDESEVNEVSPPGWNGTTKAMKKHKEISNPFALAWYMKNKGDKAHYKPEKTDESQINEYEDEENHFKSGDKVHLTDGGKEVFTVGHQGRHASHHWVGDEQNRGWFASEDQMRHTKSCSHCKQKGED